ncbi:site-specific DNA-methyltransferase [Sphingomonas ginsenosidimutans]|jgi:site-specific DNA-methyltransferase (adenine-specific)|uniref:site-specific DNA-methyltransferase (adenine-specific) n=1 Tax=Sphingomonas ginsenosidimutans TaxID=862134 RepID=A0A2A4HZJ7_9SPHN|nr:DNA methyltransferase [Sphingomonas ginsenosidimutans]MEE2917257.1 DNA methyltransferase [Pseudomonadota bacterium]PCG09413.1 site-specific DNA-methyltransferase [Sphingomonas ginsenosidimutans]
MSRTANRPANHLYYGDNLDVLRREIADGSVDLVYLDPPFNSNASYNILFKSPTGATADAQIEAFVDTWHWNDRAEDAFDQVARSGHTRAFDLLNAMRRFLGDNDMMAYLAMMAVRMIELHRVLRPTGSLYLHCDSTASHYLKLLLDAVFGADRYRNEIIWKRTTAHNDAGRWGRNLDTLLFYTRSPDYAWHPQTLAYEPEYEARFRQRDADGRRWMDDNLTAKGLSGGGYTYEYKGVTSLWRMPRETMERLDAEGRLHFTRGGGGIRLKRYLDEAKGTAVQALWTDIPALNSQAQERLGYPTQKPVALLERIIAASSNEGDVVLDPFCGCGTAVHAAQKLGRQWIGIDVTHLAISLIEKRMQAAFPGVAFTVEGTPKDLESAMDLARRDKYQFQWWAVSMVDAMPYGGKKKGADGGVDGIIYFKPDGKRTERAIVSVKGGDHVGVGMIRDLHSAMEREKAPAGIFLCKATPTTVMEKEAAAVGRFAAAATGKTYPRLQIITLAELFRGKRPDLPLVDPTAAFRRAAREDTGRQTSLF